MTNKAEQEQIKKHIAGQPEPKRSDMMKDINLGTLEAAIRHGLEAPL